MIHDYEAELILKDGRMPIFHAAYTVPYKLREKVKEKLDRLTNEKIIEPIKYSQWVSPIVIVSKPNGEVRICLDGKASLNKCVEFNHYPSLLIEDIFAEFANCKLFCVCDCD